MIIQSVKKNRRLIGSVVGSGIVARAADEGGADFLLALNAGRLRSMGAPSIACMLPIRDALHDTLDFASSEVLPLTELPVLIGINCWQAEASEKDFAKRIMDAGFAGAVNFPPSMYYSDSFSHILDRSGLGLRQEITVLENIKEEGGTVLFYCLTRNQARMAADADLDGLVLNFGWNTGGLFGHKSNQSLEEAALFAADVSKYVKSRRPQLAIFLEGGPILSEADLNYVSQKSKIDGYVGGSTLDRVPIEAAIADQIAKYRVAVQQRFELRDHDKFLIQSANKFGMVGKSRIFVRTLRQIERAAKATDHVGISVPQGGPAKEVVGLFERLSSKRTYAQFIELSHETHTLPELNDILFGHKDESDQIGLMGQDRHIIVINDFHVLSARFQKRIFRIIQMGYYTAIGSMKRRQARAKLVLLYQGRGLATKFESQANINLIDFPALIDRREDLPDVLEGALARFGTDENTRVQLSVALIQKICAMDWKNNEDEFYKMARRLADVMDIETIKPDILDNILSNRISTPDMPIDGLGQREQILTALSNHAFNRTKTASALGISRKTLYNRMKRLQLC